MAGIGFELKKLFRRKGLLAGLRAYGCAGILCTGPMLLGALLQLGILVLCGWAGAAKTEQDLLVCMVTDTLLASLTVTSLFAMPVTRFLADMLYEEQEQLVLPSFWGANALLLAGGCGLYGLFLLVSGATLLQGLLCLALFAEMIVNWNAMSLLTALKDYRSVLIAFAAAVGTAFGAGALLVLLARAPALEGFLFAVALGYGVMLMLDVWRLCRYFPDRQGSPWLFLRWVDRFLPLALTGLCTDIGLFALQVLKGLDLVVVLADGQSGVDVTVGSGEIISQGALVGDLHAVADHVKASSVQTGEQAVPIALHILRLHAQLFGNGAGDLHIIAHQSVALVMVAPGLPCALQCHDQLATGLNGSQLVSRRTGSRGCTGACGGGGAAVGAAGQGQNAGGGHDTHHRNKSSALHS